MSRGKTKTMRIHAENKHVEWRQEKENEMNQINELIEKEGKNTPIVKELRISLLQRNALLFASRKEKDLFKEMNSRN